MTNFTKKDRENLGKCVTLLEESRTDLVDHESRLRKLEAGHVRFATIFTILGTSIGGILTYFFNE